MRLFSYNGTLEFQALNDEVIRANYQHKHVVDHYLRYFKNKKVLDAGCWTGTIEKEVSRRKLPCKMVGIDLNKDALTVAKNKFPKFHFYQVDLYKPDLTFMKKYQGTFDTAIFLDVIEHVPVGTEIQVLRTINKLLKPGGALILSTMLDHKINLIDPAWFFGHRHYSTETIEKMLKSAKFKSVETLKIGNLFWDLDLLLLYIYKHIFQKVYKTNKFIFSNILRGLEPPQKFATRIYSLSLKK